MRKIGKRAILHCPESHRWFLKNFPGGEADYQAILDALAREGKTDWAIQLLAGAGPDEKALIEVDEIKGTHFFAAGRLVVKKSIELSGELYAGIGIEAGGNIVVAGPIKAGKGISAGGSIRAQTITMEGISHIDVPADGLLVFNASAFSVPDIKAGKDIKVQYNIGGRANISAGGNIEARMAIEAQNISAGGNVVSDHITADSVEAGGHVRDGDRVTPKWQKWTPRESGK